MIGKCHHRSCRVVAHSRKCEECIQFVGHCSTVTLDHEFGGFVEMTTPTRIPEPLPNRQQVPEWSTRTYLRRRKGRHELEVLGQHAMHLRLLQHHFTDEHRPSITRGAPRQIPKSLHTPFKDGVDDLFYAPQTSWPSYGRLRSGSADRFHTITRRRK